VQPGHQSYFYFSNYNCSGAGSYDKELSWALPELISQAARAATPCSENRCFSLQSSATRANRRRDGETRWRGKEGRRRGERAPGGEGEGPPEGGLAPLRPAAPGAMGGKTPRHGNSDRGGGGGDSRDMGTHTLCCEEDTQALLTSLQRCPPKSMNFGVTQRCRPLNLCHPAHPTAPSRNRNRDHVTERGDLTSAVLQVNRTSCIWEGKPQWDTVYTESSKFTTHILFSVRSNRYSRSGLISFPETRFQSSFELFDTTSFEILRNAS